MMFASRPPGKTHARPQIPGLGGHRAVGMMEILRVVRMVVAEGC